MFISMENLSSAHSDFVAEIMVPRLYRDRRMAQTGTEIGDTARKGLRKDHNIPWSTA